MLWGRQKLCSLHESSSSQAYYKMSEPINKSFSNTTIWCCKPVLNVRSSSLILPSTSGSSYISMSSEIIQVWLVLRSTLSVILLTFCSHFNLHCLTSCTTFSPCSWPIYLFVLHSVWRTHSSGPQMCSFYVYFPHNYSVTWLSTFCNANWTAHINLFSKTSSTVQIVPLHIYLNGDIFENETFQLWYPFNNISNYYGI